VYTLNKSQVEIIKRGLTDSSQLDFFTGYWFDKGGGHGFQFDRGFVPEYAWQKKLVFAQQNLICGVMGIGSGKTLGVGMAAYTWAMSTEGFKFMNGANWAYQSRLMKDLIETQIIDTPAENLVDNSVDTPYPKITLAYKIGKITYRSTMEFMSMDKQAAKIFSWRGDWINLDEAALIDQLDVALMNLSTRLTGKTARGREYLARMSLMTNPWANESATHVYYFYDLAIDNPDECLSISVPTSANTNITERQIKNTLRFIRDPEEQERLLDGQRPEGKGLFFSKPSVGQCADPYMSEYIETKFKAGVPGFQVVKAMSFGVIEYQTPKTSDYCFLVGDPGTGNFPARNAPCIAVIDASGLPQEPAFIVAFWWGSGNRRIQPFMNKFYDYKDKYRPIFAGVDSTGPQAGMVQLMNLTKVWSGQVESLADQQSVYGMDFSVGRKDSMLLANRNLLELGLIRWADFAKGIKMQYYNYDRALDRSGQPKIAQDIVACLSMGAFAIRAYYNIGPDEQAERERQVRSNLDTAYRNIRRPAQERNYRSR